MMKHRHALLLTTILLITATLLLVSSASSSDTNNNSHTKTTTTTTTAFQPPQQPPKTMRAWQCHGRNQRQLVEHLAQAGIATSRAVQDVMRAVDRQYYVPHQPYMDAPQLIGNGQTISAPHMHAHVLEEILPVLQAQPEPLRVLDVGCGSGYLTACLGRWFQALPSSSSSATTTTSDENTNTNDGSILGKKGRVFGIDIIPHLVHLSEQNMLQADRDLLDSKVVQLQVANGWDGLPEQAPFDAIHVGAAAADFPRNLALQLKVGGILIVPIGPEGGVQNLYKIERVAEKEPGVFDASDYRLTKLLGVRYVPLVHDY